LLFLSSFENNKLSLFDYVYAKFLWRAIHILFGLTPPTDMSDLFFVWSKNRHKKYNSLLLTVSAALYWAIWLTRNKVVFDKCRLKTFLQVLFKKCIGSDSEQANSDMMIRETNWSKLDSSLKTFLQVYQLCNFFSFNGCLSSKYIGHILV